MIFFFWGGGPRICFDQPVPLNLLARIETIHSTDQRKVNESDKDLVWS